MKVLKIIGIVFAVLIIIAGVAGYFLQQSMTKFQSKARQQMSKIMLSSMYTANMATHAEYNFYSTDLATIGFFPEGELDAKVGFTNPSESLEPQFGQEFNPALKDTDALVQSGKAPFTYSDRVANISFQEVAQKHCPECTASKEAFKAIAFSNIDDDPTLDVWTIDQDKNMVNVVNDLEN